MDHQLCGGMTTRQYTLRNCTLAHAVKVTQRPTDTPCCPMRAADHSVFVGDLAPEVNDYTLQEHFRQYFSSVRSAKVCPCRQGAVSGVLVAGKAYDAGLCKRGATSLTLRPMRAAAAARDSLLPTLLAGEQQSCCAVCVAGREFRGHQVPASRNPQCSTRGLVLPGC